MTPFLAGLLWQLSVKKGEVEMLLVITASAGLFAALLMFCGDMLLYFTTQDFKVDSTLAPYVGIMKALPVCRLRLGGLLGPVAAFFYCVGFGSILLMTVEESKATALLATLLCALGIIVGGAYHSHFTYLGLLGKAGPPDWLPVVAKNIRLLSNVSTVLIALGMALLAGLIVLGKTGYPRWFVVLTPAVTYFLAPLWKRLPQPLRVVLLGGWYNLMFALFFVVLLLLA